MNNISFLLENASCRIESNTQNTIVNLMKAKEACIKNCI